MAESVEKAKTTKIERAIETVYWIGFLGLLVVMYKVPLVTENVPVYIRDIISIVGILTWVNLRDLLLRKLRGEERLKRSIVLIDWILIPLGAVILYAVIFTSGAFDPFSETAKVLFYIIVVIFVFLVWYFARD